MVLYCESVSEINPFLPQVGFGWHFIIETEAQAEQLLSDNLGVRHRLPPYELLVREAPEAPKAI